MRRKYAVIVAGGKGLRMGGTIPKQFLLLGDKPLLFYSIQAFLTAFPDITLVLVFPAVRSEHFEKYILTSFSGSVVIPVRGGATRFESVKNGLKVIKSPSVIFVHDGVRPLVSSALIQNCYQEAMKHGSAVPAIKVKDSIRRVDKKGSFAADREHFRAIQTPQTFLSEILLPSFEQAYHPGFTDEATVVERAGHPIHLVEGEDENIKITRPIDLQIAEQLLLSRK